jgi:hypothetical protein
MASNLDCPKRVLKTTLSDEIVISIGQIVGLMFCFGHKKWENFDEFPEVKFLIEKWYFRIAHVSLFCIVMSFSCLRANIIMCDVVRLWGSSCFREIITSIVRISQEP